VRDDGLVFGAIASVTVPLPVPLDGTTVIQAAPGEVVQAHPVVVDTLTVDVALGLPTDRVNGATVNTHAAAAACVTVTAWPAMVTVAVRGVVAVLAPRVSVTVAPPDPLAGATVTQLAPELAVHAQPAGAVIVVAMAPPPLPTDKLVGDTLKEHGVPIDSVKGLEALLREVP
jgi:hypothetical protein